MFKDLSRVMHAHIQRAASVEARKAIRTRRPVANLRSRRYVVTLRINPGSAAVTRREDWINCLFISSGDSYYRPARGGGPVIAGVGSTFPRRARARAFSHVRVPRSARDFRAYTPPFPFHPRPLPLSVLPAPPRARARFIL